MKKFFECFLPVTQCNLECEYCYIIQENRRTMKNPKPLFSLEQIKSALSKDRMGGVCYFSICGAGETLLAYDCINIVKVILKNEHYVNITTNGTITKKIEDLCAFDIELRKRLHVAMSFHFLELKKRNLLEIFWKNLAKLREAEISYTVQLNLYDGYMPYLEDIKKECLENARALPQIALTRKEPSNKIGKDVIVHTDNLENYVKAAKEFNSPLFECTINNFMIKRREFCYAGEWSGCLNLSNGELKKCYCSSYVQNIFDNLQKPIIFEPVGNFCRNKYCVNSSHFLALGVIPNLKIPTYQELRNREEVGWYSQEMFDFLSRKLIDDNCIYTTHEKLYYNYIHIIREIGGVIKKTKKLMVGKILNGK